MTRQRRPHPRRRRTWGRPAQVRRGGSGPASRSGWWIHRGGARQMGRRAPSFLSTRTSRAATPREAPEPSMDTRNTQAMDDEFAIGFLVSTVNASHPFGAHCARDMPLLQCAIGRAVRDYPRRQRRCSNGTAFPDGTSVACGRDPTILRHGAGPGQAYIAESPPTTEGGLSQPRLRCDVEVAVHVLGAINARRRAHEVSELGCRSDDYAALNSEV